LRRIAEKAGDEQTGARGLMTVCERVFREIKFEMPSTAVKRFVVTRELVDEPVAELQKILTDPRQEERIVAGQLVEEFARRFQENHGLKISFTAAARDLLVNEALEKSQSVRDFCAKRFKDFQFGLRLIAQNSGHMVPHDRPDLVISQLRLLIDYLRGKSKPAFGSTTIE